MLKYRILGLECATLNIEHRTLIPSYIHKELSAVVVEWSNDPIVD